MPDRNEVVGSPLRVRGELDLHALKAQDSSGLLDGIDRAVVWDIKMTTRFRGIARRDGVLLHGRAGWGEVAPFWNHDLDASVPWLASGLEWALAGTTGLPRNRYSVPVNVTIPEVSPAAARTLVRRSRADTAKVKVAGARTSASSTTATSATSASTRPPPSSSSFPNSWSSPPPRPRSCPASSTICTASASS